MTENGKFTIEKYYYSERGVVHSIIEDICTGTEKEQKEKLEKFLGSIEFLNHPKYFTEEIESVKFIDELDFSEFGSPDLIVVINKKIAIFIEAKIASYEKSCIKVEEGHEEHFKGNTSKINIQLALKYRFWQALKNWNGKVEDGIVEKEGHIVFHENDKKARRLLKPFVIQNYILNLELNKCEEAYFVAMVNDDKELSEKHPIFQHSTCPPVFSEWNELEKKFGILRYSSLVTNNVVSEDKGQYAFVSKIFKEDSAKLGHADDICVRLRTTNINNENSLLRCFSGIKEKKGYKCEGGSLSKIEKNMGVTAKIFEYKNKVYVGRKIMQDECCSDKFRVVINNVYFICEELDVSSQNTDIIIDAAEKILDTLLKI